MLSIGFLADHYGIPQITFGIALLIALFALANVAWVVSIRHRREPSPETTLPTQD
jgi:hypothetical protein